MKQKFIMLLLIFSIILGGVQLPLSVSAEVADIELTATSGASKVTLEWDQVEGARLYLVGKSTTPGESTTIISGQIDPSTLTYTDTDVENGVTYYYTIFASVEGKPLQPSNEV
ncbi:hypothetical protein WAK64_16640, partial [Bacillus spongiae]